MHLSWKKKSLKKTLLLWHVLGILGAMNPNLAVGKF